MLVLDQTAADQVRDLIRALVEQRDRYKLELERAEGTIHRLRITNDELRKEISDAARRNEK